MNPYLKRLKVRPMATLEQVDAELQAALAPYGISVGAYLSTIENPPRLPPGTVDSREYLRRISDLKARLDQSSSPELERQMWEFTLMTRPIDGVSFRMRITRLLRARCDLIRAENTVQATRMVAEREALEEFRRKSF